MSTVVTWTSFFPTSVLNDARHLQVDVADRPAGLGDVEHRAPEFRPLAEPLPQFGIGRQPLHGLEEHRRVTRRDEEGVDFVLEDLGHATDITRNNR